jgi:two-component system NtrC family sensor kinase
MRVSLQVKFISVAFLALLGITSLISFITIVKTRSALYQATEKQGRILAQTVSALIINELIYEKLGLVEEGGLIDNYMRDLHQRSDIDLNYVAVLDNSFRIISHNEFKEFGKIYQSKILFRTKESGQVEVMKLDKDISLTPELEFATPLAIEGKSWGFLVFSLSLAGMEKEMKTIIFQILTYSTFALLFLFVIMYLLSRTFIRPITSLSDAMGEVEVEMGEKKLPVKGNDELGRLAESYNEMVTRIRMANEEMKVAQEKLIQSEKLATLGVLSSSVAHRINNPLGGLFNCVGLLRKKGDDPEFRKNYLELLEEGLHSIRETVGQLLYTAGKRVGEERRAKVDHVVSGVLKFLDYRLKKQNINFAKDIDDDLHVPVAPHDLEEILINTMVNSIQAMENGGSLRVNGYKQDSRVEIQIKDTGSGISEEDLAQVFDLFYSTKGADEGTGLGMWMTYEIVKRYKGEITITSQPQAGTTVRVYFPEGT